MIRPSVARLLLPGIALALVVGMTACGPSSGDGPRTTDGPTSTPTPSSSTGELTAADALALGGLHLPAGAKDAKVEVVPPADSSPYEEHYRISFTAPQASAVAFCGSGDLGGDLPAVALSPSDKVDLGEAATVVEGSRYCGSQDPAHTQWNRTALVTPGEPASVLVSVGRMKR